MVKAMEIERKWNVSGWPYSLVPSKVYLMEQGYISTAPTVRIRKEEIKGGKTEYVLCFKGKPDESGLSREEIETLIDEELFGKLKKLIGKPLISKVRNTYILDGGLELEVNLVDEGLDTEFFYAEIEFETEEEARGWKPYNEELSAYLSDECTGKPGASMAAYWIETRRP